MQQINLIGKVIRKPKEFTSDNSDRYYFVIRAENTPPSDEFSYFDFNVISSNARIKNKLTIGTSVFVTGLLSIEKYGSNKEIVTKVMSTYISITDAAIRSENIDIKMIAGSIPLDF